MINANNSSKYNKKATIYDIAAEVQTSAATVSRVLSNSGYPVKEELRAKIIGVAKKLNYSPNIVGRMLKKNDSMEIGVIVPTISNPFYSQLILGIELEARNRGFNILLCSSFRDTAIEIKYIESLYQKQVRGVIISSINDNHSFIKEMQNNGIKIAVLDQEINDLKCSRIGFDHLKGSIMAVDYLADLGHKNIAFLTSPLTRQTRKNTLEGFRLGLLKNNLPVNSENIIASESEKEIETGIYEFENGKELAKKFLKLKNRPTAILAINDITAFGIIQELSNNDVRVPEDVSVIGFDDIEVSSMINPPLTTIFQPSFKTGQLACKLLLDNLNGDEDSNVSIQLEPSLVIRKSVKDLRL